MYKKIMVPLDGSELAECVLPHVAAFSADCQVSTIVFTQVIEPAPLHLRRGYATIEVDYMKIQENTARVEYLMKSSAAEYLKQVVSRFKSNGARLIAQVMVGKTADQLVQYAEANQIDLILIATHGRSGLSRWVRGSIADRILRAAHVPVLMVRAPGAIGEPKQKEKSND